MHSLVLHEITKRFSTAEVLHSITLEVATGQRIAVVGESGSGKTTLLRIIAGLEQPTSGRVRMDDRDVTTTPANKRGVGVVFQDYATYPRLSVAENLGVALVGGGINRAEKEARLGEIAEWLGLKALLKRLPSELSGGQLQRVALGKVLMARPNLLLLDEPFSQLDVRLAEQMRHWLAECHRRYGMTQIMVTHDPFDALTSVDKLAVLHRGKLSQFAPPDEVRRKPLTLFAAQLTSPCGLNVLPAGLVTAGSLINEALMSNGYDLQSLKGADAGSTSDNRATVAIRPECVHLLDEPAPGSDKLLVETRMLGMRDLGIVRLVELGLGSFRLCMKWPAAAGPVCTGDKVICAIQRDDLMVFAD